MLVVFLLLLLVQGLVAKCPSQCSCRHIGAQAEWLRVKCEGKFQSIRDINLNNVSVEITQLDLSKNEIETLEQGVFQNLTNLKLLNLSDNKIVFLNESSFEGLNVLEKLYLSKNSITSVQPNTLKRLPKLKKLDLSENKLSELDETLLIDLQSIERLKLNANSITSLKEDTFSNLKSLKQLDISNNPWNCDCNLIWFSNWLSNTSVKIITSPKCMTPISLKGQQIKKLRSLKEIQCDSINPQMEILPDQSQVVFAGDSLTIKCRVTSTVQDKNGAVNWVWNPNKTEEKDFSIFKSPENVFTNIKIENIHIADKGLDSHLTIMQVNEEHMGQWKCYLSSDGNTSKSINIFVISNQTRYCSLAVTRNNKGVYTWPQMIVGYTAELPCEGSGLSGLTPVPLRATYHCNDSAEWSSLNTDSCPFVSTVTKILEQFSKVNLSLAKGSLMDTLKKFQNYTTDSTLLTDPIEINFITQTIENYLTFLREGKEVGLMLADVVNSVLNAPRELIALAQENYKVCTRLVKAVEMVTAYTPSIQAHKSNMALEEFTINSDSFSGLTCTWYSGTDSSKLLHCATNNRSTTIGLADKTIEASVQLPASLFQQLGGSTIAYQLMIAMYGDNKFFPVMNEDENMDVLSCVIGSKLIGIPVQNLTEPVFVMLKVPMYHHAIHKPKPVVWDTSINQTGGWTSDGCYLMSLMSNLIIFHCNRLGYYGILQDSSYFDKNDKSLKGAKFKFSNPAIYVGSFMLMFCLVCTTLTYICCYASIVMPKKSKHCFINTWIAMILVCGLYTAGIHQTENIEICQGIGLTLHYLSLCCLFWMTVSASTMYKRLSSCDPDSLSDNESLDPPLKKPILGLYLVGWGIALIICGISGAVNLREYSTFTYCFLSTGPTLTAVFVPAVVLLFYLLILHLLIRCAIKNVDINGQTSEGTQATENVDLELLEPNIPVTADRQSLRSMRTVSSETEDQEHTQITQLRGQMLVLAFYLLTWSSGALTTSDLLSLKFPYNEMTFAILYAVSASCLGMFILLFHGIARSDVRMQWLKMRCWLKKKKNSCCRTRNVTDVANPQIPAQPLVQGITNPLSASQATQVTSDTNSVNSSRHGTEKSHNSCGLSSKGMVAAGSLAKPKDCVNTNLLVLHRQQYRSNNSVTTYNTDSASMCVEMFYNPHQSGVARKFFKRQRRNLKHSTLGPRKQGDGGATSDGGSCVSVPRRAVRSNSIGKNDNATTSKMNGMQNLSNRLSNCESGVSENRRSRFIIGQENEMNGMARQENCVQQSENEEYQEQSTSEIDSMQQTAATCDTPYDSDCKSKLEEKIVRNVSQQCSLDCTSELESVTQIASEKSENNISEMSDGASKHTVPPLSVSDVSDCENVCHNLRSNLPLGVHSNSLYSLHVSHPVPIKSRSCHSSLNDVTSFASSKNCEFSVSRSSKTDGPSTGSSRFFDKVDDVPDCIDRVSSFLSDKIYHRSSKSDFEMDEDDSTAKSYVDGIAIVDEKIISDRFERLIDFEAPIEKVINGCAELKISKRELSEDDEFEEVNKETSV